MFSSSLVASELPLPEQAHIVVNGYGSVEQVPDIIKLRFEVNATADSFAAAKNTVDTTVAKAINAATQQGIHADDINASKISAAPQYDWEDRLRIYRGERVNRQIEIKLTDVSRYNALVEGLLAAGISRLQPVQMDFSQRQQLQQLALTHALDDAKLQAETIAKHLGTKLDGVFQIAPQQRGMGGHRLAMAADTSLKQAELKPSKQILEQRVRVVYLLK
ncbi:MAG: hypothetical protein ACJAYG_002120 [Oceanicoccus sp.]|jgi:uncharacterized protein YggE